MDFLFDQGKHLTIYQSTLKSLFFVSLTLLIAIVVDNLLRSFIKIPKSLENRRARSYAMIFRNIITTIVYLIALNIIFLQLGINITPLLASASIIGLAIGIGARPIIEDLISGLFLLSEDIIATGDYVKIEEAEGYIETIGFRTLSLRDENGAIYVIPNGQIKKLQNFSRNKFRVTIDVPLKADQNIDKAIKTAKEALALLQQEKDLTSSLFPGATVNGIEEFKPTGPLMLRITIVTYPARRFEVGRRYRYLLKKQFEKNKILFG